MIHGQHLRQLLAYFLLEHDAGRYELSMRILELQPSFRIVDLIAAADRDATALRDGRELAVIIAQHLPTRAEIEAAKAIGDAPG